MNNEPKELSVDEAREKFLIKMWQLIDYWDKTPDSITDGFGGFIKQGQRERLEGLMHSVLASGFDGAGLDLPPMEIKPILPLGDVEYHKANGENWFPTVDIGGDLHSELFTVGKKHNFIK